MSLTTRRTLEKRWKKMAKLVKQKYRNAKGECKTFSYTASISKKVIEDAGWTGEEHIRVYAKDKKIIIEKED